MLILRRGRSVQPVGSGLDIEMLYETGAGRGRRTNSREPWRPPTEVFECSDGLVVRIEIAGLALHDIHVTVEGDELHVRGERAAAYPTGPKLYHESRIRYGSFDAAVRLPFPVAVGDANATYIDGLLNIRLPRRVAAQAPMRDDADTHEPDRGER